MVGLVNNLFLAKSSNYPTDLNVIKLSNQLKIFRISDFLKDVQLSNHFYTSLRPVGQYFKKTSKNILRWFN